MRNTGLAGHRSRGLSSGTDDRSFTLRWGYGWLTSWSVTFLETVKGRGQGKDFTLRDLRPLRACSAKECGRLSVPIPRSGVLTFTTLAAKLGIVCVARSVPIPGSGVLTWCVDRGDGDDKR